MYLKEWVVIDAKVFKLVIWVHHICVALLLFWLQLFSQVFEVVFIVVTISLLFHHYRLVSSFFVELGYFKIAKVLLPHFDFNILELGFPVQYF